MTCLQGRYYGILLLLRTVQIFFITRIKLIFFNKSQEVFYVISHLVSSHCATHTHSVPTHIQTLCPHTHSLCLHTLSVSTHTHSVLHVHYAADAAKLLQLCLTLCDPRDGSPQAPQSLGFSRQEHWSGLPFPSPMHESEK